MPPIMATGKVDIFAFIGGSKAADALLKIHPEPHRLKARADLPLLPCPRGTVSLHLPLLPCPRGTVSLRAVRLSTHTAPSHFTAQHGMVARDCAPRRLRPHRLLPPLHTRPRSRSTPRTWAW